MNSTLATPLSLRRPPRQKAPSDPVKAHLLFMVNGEAYACPIDTIEHVIRRSDANLRPKTAESTPWEVGRLMHQNKELPVICLRILWALPPAATETGREALLVINLPGPSFALVVDECLTVISSLSAGTARLPLPVQLRGPRGIAFDTAIHWQDRLIVTVQLHKLLAAEFETLLVPAQAGPASL